MRTTIDIPDDVLRRAKAEAELRGVGLEELVRDALERLIPDTEQPQHTDDPPQVLDKPWIVQQRLGPNCVLPLILGPTGPLMPTLVGGEAQRLLDREDIERDTDPR